MSRARDRIVRRLERHKEFLDFTKGDLGADLLKAATDGVRENLLDQKTPDGTPWDELSGPYAKWKARHHPGKPVGVLHGVMTRPEEVAGTPTVTPDRARVEYGISETAKAEAAWFSKLRPFWGLTASSKAASREILRRRFRAVVRG